MLRLTVHIMQGNTALHDAAYWSRMHVVEVLLAKGADVNAKNNRVNFTLLNNCEQGVRWQQHNMFSCLAFKRVSNQNK